MPITSNITKKPDSRVEIEIAIDQQDVDASFKEAYTEVAKKARIKGFRPGKAPADVIRLKYGPAIAHDVQEKLLNNAFQQALQEHELRPVNPGEIVGDMQPVTEGKPYAITLAVDVYPEFDLPEYKEVSVTKNTYALKDKDVEQELDTIRTRFSAPENRDRPVEKKDSVNISYEVVYQGEVLEKYAREDYTYDMEHGTSFPDLKTKLAGHSAGETLDIKSAFPEKFPDKDLAGKDVVFRVTIKNVQEMIKPELNDEFVQKISPDKTVDEFKQNLKANMERAARDREAQDVQNAIVEELIKKAEIPLPSSMIESEIDALADGFKRDLTRAGLSLEDYLAETKTTEEGIRDKFRESAVAQVKGLLLLSAIARKEDIKVSEEEVDQQIQAMADQYRQPFDATKAYLQEQGEIDSIRFSLRKNKTLKFLEDNAKIKSGKTLSFQDLRKN